mmetsp:Transcript_7678/g.11030  ORF Transcript_7678/g.11030 Transcript_7678/m.11030 type:complete len:96 (-) Transcript_7678:2135-2422(-)
MGEMHAYVKQIMTTRSWFGYSTPSMRVSLLYTSSSSLWVKNLCLNIARRKTFRNKAPSRNITMGRPASVLVIISVTKNPTIVGKERPRISNTEEG